MGTALCLGRRQCAEGEKKEARVRAARRGVPWTMLVGWGECPKPERRARLCLTWTWLGHPPHARTQKADDSLSERVGAGSHGFRANFAAQYEEGSVMYDTAHDRLVYCIGRDICKTRGRSRGTKSLSGKKEEEEKKEEKKKGEGRDTRAKVSHCPLTVIASHRIASRRIAPIRRLGGRPRFDGRRKYDRGNVEKQNKTGDSGRSRGRQEGRKGKNLRELALSPSSSVGC